VVAILAITLRVVIPSFMDDIPEAQVQSDARQLAAKLSYLRSESKLQGQRYGLEIEAPTDGPHRYRIIMPREQRIVREGSELWGMDLPEWGRSTVAVIPQFGAFFGKLLFFCWMFIWVRWTLPRFRYDQVMRLGWKQLIPLSFLNVFITGLIVILLSS